MQSEDRATDAGILTLDLALQRKAPWKSNRSPEVNDPPSDYFEAQLANDGVLGVTNAYAGQLNYAGGLVSTNRQVQRDSKGNFLPYVALHTKFRWPSWAYKNLARFEFDVKVCPKTRPNANTKIRNVANFSGQWNRETGMWQIDKDPPKWVDTGFVVPEIEPGYWHDLDYRLWFNYDPNDETKCVFSVLSIELDGDCYMIPEPLQNVAMSLTNWEECAKVQKQNEMLKPGSTAIEYMETGLAWSDAAIGKIAWVM